VQPGVKVVIGHGALNPAGTIGAEDAGCSVGIYHTIGVAFGAGPGIGIEGLEGPGMQTIVFFDGGLNERGVLQTAPPCPLVFNAMSQAICSQREKT
jgi:hypothetical protein